MLATSRHSRHLAKLQKIFIRGLLAQLEKNLPGVLPTRQPRCLVAIEENNLVAFMVLQPYNRRGTCWSIADIEIIEEPNKESLYELRLKLIKSALQLEDNRTKSWVIKCSTSDSDEISIGRELGFQPLKIFKSWLPPKNKLKTIEFQSQPPLPDGLDWEPLKRINVPLLWSLEKGNESSQLRQILDRQWSDLLDQNQYGSGILISRRSQITTAIAGFLSHNLNNKQPPLQLLRDPGWDTRLSDSLEIILDMQANINPSCIVETSSEDRVLNNFLGEVSWQESGENILLGRTLWKRQLNNKFIPRKRPLESMLEQLTPQQPPLPSPSLSKR